MASSSSRLTERGVLEGHNGWVTSIATTSENPDMIVTGSRDRSVMVWDITRSDGAEFGVARRNMRGHNHFVSDVVISNDGQFALSSSWDATLRLWELSTGRTTRRFAGHTKDALAVAFSADNRQIVSASRDRSVKLWNTLGECKYTIGGDEGHQDWVSCVRFSPIPPSADTPSTFVSCGWDGKVKVWTLSNFRSTATLSDHTGYLNSATISPDGSLCASGGRDGSAILWDLNEAKKLYSLDAGETINTLLFSPTRYWLCAATTSGIKIWDLESKQLVEEIKVEPAAGASPRALKVHPVSLAWSPDGSVLYSGWTDNKVRCHQVL